MWFFCVNQCDSECDWMSAQAILPPSCGQFQQHHGGHCEGVCSKWLTNHLWQKRNL